MTSLSISFWKVFRIVFVILFLYHLEEVFYYWDAFRYYSSFSEFLPNVALVSIFWTIIALIISVAVWLLSGIFEYCFRRMKWKTGTAYVTLFLIFYGALLATGWVDKKLQLFNSAKRFLKQILLFCRDWIRHYASASQFLPDTVIVWILWGGIAAATSLIIWFSLRHIERLCHRSGWKVTRRQLYLFLCIFVLMIVALWAYKKFVIIPHGWESLIRTIVIAGLSVFLTWKYRAKFEQISGFFQECTARLLWMFGIFVILSAPLVAYQMWFTKADKNILNKISPSVPADKKHPNFILVTFDALTARDMSLYGYQKETTPFLSEWAKKAAVFTQAEAEGNFTTPTTASLMTGKMIWTHQVFQLSGSIPVRSDMESLPLLLKKNGYYNAAFIVNHHASVQRLGMAGSFDFAPKATEFMVSENIITLLETAFGDIEIFVYRIFGEKMRLFYWIFKDKILYDFTMKFIKPKITKTTVPPEKAFNSFWDIYDSLPEPFFVWIHLFPPHEPYLPPEPFKGMFHEDTQVEDQHPGTPKGRYRRPDYDAFIRYCDRQFEDFILKTTDKDKQQNRLKNTAIIFSSDHGESFQHDVFAHKHPHLYEQLTHIPLIIKEPGQTEGKVIDDLVKQVDIPATILSLSGIPLPSWMEGRSLVPLMHDGALPPKPRFAMYFEKNRSRGHEIHKGTIAVWEGDYKLIHYLEEKKSLLFNLKKDPEEMQNLFDKEPELGAHLVNLIYENLKEANRKIREGQ